MSKKRTSLDAIISRNVKQPPAEETPVPPLVPARAAEVGERPHVKQQTAYLPLAVHEQLRRLAFDERAKMHDYLLEGLDLLFQKKGLPGIAELKKKSPERPRLSQ
jgi:hypothetical protein